MEALMLRVFVMCDATGDLAGHRDRGIVVVQPLHVAPGPLAPYEIVYPEQRLDIEGSQGDRNLLR